MNKAELKERWGTYCDTDKLVDDVQNILNITRNRSTEHGICTMLYEYFTNKEPLIKMFKTSPNYVGDMRVIIKHGFDRQIDRWAVSSFCNNFTGDIHASKEILKDRDDNNKTISDYMKVGFTTINVKNIADNRATMEKRVQSLNQFNKHDGYTVKSHERYNNFMDDMRTFSNHAASTFVKDRQMHFGLIKAGTKTSRAFGKACTYYGVDKAEDYNKLFAKYADMVASGCRNLYFVMSLNPLDYLTMSFGESWKSCHHIANGSWKSGCVSYMLDAASIVTFVVNDISAPIHEHGKIYREMFHYNNNTLIQSRIYPQGNDGAMDLYAQFRCIVQELFNPILHREDNAPWHHESGRHISNYITTYGTHYKDYNYHNETTIFAPIHSDYARMEVGHAPICFVCGEVHNIGGSLLCNRCYY